jgi:hypothetical protein
VKPELHEERALHKLAPTVRLSRDLRDLIFPGPRLLVGI